MKKSSNFFKKIIIAFFALFISVSIVYAVIGARPWDDVTWSSKTTVEKSVLVETFISTNFSQAGTLTLAPWDNPAYVSMTQDQKVSEQKEWQYLKSKVSLNRPMVITIGGQDKEITTTDITKSYFIPGKTETERVSINGAITAGSLVNVTIEDVMSFGDLDLMIGSYTGGIKAYKNTGSVSSPTWTAQASWDIPVAPTYYYLQAPTLGDLDGDGDVDLITGDYRGPIYAYENTGDNTNPIWVVKPSWDPPSAAYTAPTLVDLDNDGDFDLMVGQIDGINRAYENTGSSSPIWTRKVAWDAPDAGIYTHPVFADMDDDGDIDMMTGEYTGFIMGYENTGSVTSPIWTRKVAWDTPDIGTWARVAIGDVDGDGDMDIFITEYTTGINYAYENTGSVTSPTWARNAVWDFPFVTTHSTPVLVDLDSDS